MPVGSERRQPPQKEKILGCQPPPESKRVGNSESHMHIGNSESHVQL